MNLDLSWLPRVGEFASLGAAFCWAVGICIYRRHGLNVPPYALNLIKNIVGLLSFGLALTLFRKPFPTSPRVVTELTASGLVGLALGDTLFFVALHKYGAQLSSALLCMAPPFAALIASAFLGETLSFPEIAGMILVTIGVTGVVIAGTTTKRKKGEARPKRDWRILWLVFVPLTHATAMVLARGALPQTSILWGTTLRLIPSVLVLILWMGYRADMTALKWIKENPRPTVWLACGAVVGTFAGLMLLSMGLTYTKAGISTAMSSTYPLWVIPMAGFFNQEPVRFHHVLYTLVAIIGVGVMVLVKGHS